jgi:glycosyltransferase involved in cell wall biosynthesis
VTGAALRVCVWPCAPNPYQRLLHQALADQGVDPRLLRDLTGSHTLNLALLPLSLAVARLRGARVFHLHWVYEFMPPWMARSHLTRLLGEWWYDTVLAVCGLLRLPVVWTAHNVVPHERVFDDDLRARRTLLRHAAGVVLHDPSAREAFEALALRLPPIVAVAPHGPYQAWDGPRPDRAQARAVLGWEADVPVLLFFGRVTRQKGVEDLLETLADLPPDAAQLVIAGPCADEVLARRLRSLAGRAPGRVRLDLRYLSETELTWHLAAADAAVMPFRSVTTSGSVLLALSLATLVVVPDLPAFRDLDEDSVVRYPAGPDGLREALNRVITMAEPERRRRALAGQEAAHERSWETAAERTAQLYRRVLAGAGRP